RAVDVRKRIEAAAFLRGAQSRSKQGNSSGCRAELVGSRPQVLALASAASCGSSADGDAAGAALTNLWLTIPRGTIAFAGRGNRGREKPPHRCSQRRRRSGSALVSYSAHTI